MSRIPVAASLALSLLSGIASIAAAQQSESTTVRSEQDLKVSLELPAQRAQCAASTAAVYQQRNTVARVQSTIKVENCAAATGAFTMTLRLRDANGEITMLEFMETWQRADDKDVNFSADYPIGENVELLSARTRGMRCTCADPSGEAAPP